MEGRDESEYLEEVEFAGHVALARSEGHDRGGRGPKLSAFFDLAEAKLRNSKLLADREVRLKWFRRSCPTADRKRSRSQGFTWGSTTRLDSPKGRSLADNRRDGKAMGN